MKRNLWIISLLVLVLLMPYQIYAQETPTPAATPHQPPDGQCVWVGTSALVIDWRTIGLHTSHDGLWAYQDMLGFSLRSYYDHAYQLSIIWEDGTTTNSTMAPDSMYLFTATTRAVRVRGVSSAQKGIWLCYPGEMEPVTPVPPPTSTPTPFPSIIATVTTPVSLHLAEVVTTSHDLVTRQSSAWTIGSDTFDLFTGLSVFLTAFGVLSIFVTFMRQRWFSPDDAD